MEKNQSLNQHQHQYQSPLEEILQLDQALPLRIQGFLLLNLRVYILQIQNQQEAVQQLPTETLIF